VHGRGVVQNKHSTDVDSTNRVRASIGAFTLKVPWGKSCSVLGRLLVLKHSTDVESTNRVRASI
jgi:hypothetical protein